MSNIDTLLAATKSENVKALINKMIEKARGTKVLNVYTDLGGTPIHSEIIPYEDCAGAEISSFRGKLYVIDFQRSMPGMLAWNERLVFDADAYIQKKAQSEAQSMSEHFDEEERRRG